MDGQMDGHGETSIPPYNFVAGGITTDHLFRPSTMRSMTVSDDQQGLLWLPKSRSQKNRQVPFSGASFESQEPV